MTHYYAKLVRGGVYLVFSKVFESYTEQEVTKAEYEYLKEVHETDLASEGNNYKVIKIHKFDCRVVEASLEEKVLEKILTAPDDLKPRKPIRE